MRNEAKLQWQIDDGICPAGIPMPAPGHGPTAAIKLFEASRPEYRVLIENTDFKWFKDHKPIDME